MRNVVKTFETIKN